MNEPDHESSASPRSRPRTVTAAAILMLVIALFNIIGGLAFLAGAGSLERAETAARVVGLMDIVIGAAQIYAGVKIWALDESGRSVGVIVSAIGLGLAMLAVARGGVGYLVPLAMNGYIFLTLVRERQAFTR